MRKILDRVHRHAHTFHKRFITTKLSKYYVAYLLFGVINVFFIFQILTVFISTPKILFGGLPIGLMTKNDIAKKINTTLDMPIRLQINNRVYTYFYRDIGIYLDTDEALKEIFLPNNKPFPKNILEFTKAFFIPRTVKPPLSFTQDFTAFVQKTVYDFSAGDDIMLFDESEKRMTLYQQEIRYGLHPTHFKTYIIDTFGTNTDPLIPPLIPIATDAQNKVTETNIKIADVFSRPLTVIMRINNADRFFTISLDDLRSDIKTDITSDAVNARFIPSENLLTKYTKNVMLAEEKEQITSTKQRLSTAIQQALHDRYIGYTGESVHVNVDSGPNSDGSLAKRYIEIDISQQRMYTFKNGVLVKSYRISSGKDYPTPTGTFEILNKTGLGFSTIYNVWMPYWMGFNYSKELHAYFGIHELPFYYSAGNKIQRPRDFIGVPNTGGCVALDIGDAKEVYQFADIGTKVVIYQ